MEWARYGRGFSLSRWVNVLVKGQEKGRDLCFGANIQLITEPLLQTYAMSYMLCGVCVFSECVFNHCVSYDGLCFITVCCVRNKALQCD